MALTKYRLGDIVEPFSKKCGIPNLQPERISGVNRDKEFFEPSHQVGEETSKYQIVPNGYYACNLMHVGRDRVLPIAFNHSGKDKVVSPAYTVFSLKDGCGVLTDYFFIMLKSEEQDRYFWFHADSSVRDGMTWGDFCDVEITAPDLPTQQKYVDIYNAMIANQQSCERGLENLKLVCDGFIEALRRNMSCEKIGKYIQEENARNNNLQVLNVQGVNSSSTFRDTKANTTGLDFHNYKIVHYNQFAYNPSRINLGSIALRKEPDDCIISPMYCVFSITDEKELLPEYLMLWFSRKEFHRSTLFYAIGSVRDTFDFNLMKEVEIPIPDIETQKAISEIYAVYIRRKEINEKLKAQIRDICPILIKGSLEEGERQ